MNYGLKELPKDKRDFQLGALFKLPDLSELPPTFELEPFSIKDQGSSDFCSAYASVGMSELQEKVVLSPYYSFALSKLISGDPDQWGQDMRTALKAHQKYGAVEWDAVPTSLLNADFDVLRRFESYPQSLLEYAEDHKKQSYFSTKGQYDDFDDIKASIWKFREKKQAVAIGVIFSWSLSQYKLDTAQDSGFGHMMYVTGWNEEGLVVINSYGKEAGKDGKHCITREVINKFVGRYGAMMMVDISPTRAKELIDRQAWTFASLWGKLKILISKLWV